MASTPSTRLRLELQALGENLNTWGDTRLNAALQRLEEAIADVVPVSMSSSAVTLTSTNYAADEARAAILIFTGTLTANSTVTVPGVEKWYWCFNQCAGSFTLTIKTAAGTGVTIPTSGVRAVYCDATNVLAMIQRDMGSNRLENVSDPTAAQDAATRAYVLARALSDFTGAVAANVSLNSFKITSLATGTISTDAVNKGQMDTAIATAGLPATAGTVLVTSADTTASYLNDAIEVTAPLTKTTNNPGANENIGLAVSAASTSAAGVAELATAEEAITGTSAALAVTPNALQVALYAAAMRF